MLPNELRVINTYKIFKSSIKKWIFYKGRMFSYNVINKIKIENKKINTKNLINIDIYPDYRRLF